MELIYKEEQLCQTNMRVEIGDKEYNVRVAKTEEERSKGLQGVE